MRRFIHMQLHSGNLSHFSHFLGKFKHDEWVTFPTIFSTFTHFSHFWPKKFQIGFIYNISSSYYSLIILKQKGHRPQFSLLINRQFEHDYTHRNLIYRSQICQNMCVHLTLNSGPTFDCTLCLVTGFSHVKCKILESEPFSANQTLRLRTPYQICDRNSWTQDSAY